MDAKELIDSINEDELYSYLEEVYYYDSNEWGEVWSIDGSGSYEDIKPVNSDKVLSGLDSVTKDCNDNYPDFYWVPKQCCGSDYSGGTIHRANYLAISEKYKEEGLICLLRGAYATYAVAVSIKGLLCGSIEAKKLIETLTKLQDHPVVDGVNTK